MNVYEIVKTHITTHGYIGDCEKSSVTSEVLIDVGLNVYIYLPCISHSTEYTNVDSR